MNGTPGWHLGPSFPDPTGFTLVDADGTVNVIPREQRAMTAQPRACPAAMPGRNAAIRRSAAARAAAPRGQLARVE